MKENNDGTDTNVGSMENSIEEAIKIMEHWVEYEKNNKEKINRADELINIQETILLNYKRALKENEELKEYIAIAPNLDEMTAIKYRNIQQDAYIRGRAEEQKKAGQIIYENYIPIQKVREMRDELDRTKAEYMEWQKQELDQKDKIIDLMAEDIDGFQMECNRYFKDKEEVKQYFENKAKEIR